MARQVPRDGRLPSDEGLSLALPYPRSGMSADDIANLAAKGRIASACRKI